MRAAISGFVMLVMGASGALAQEWAMEPVGCGTGYDIQLLSADAKVQLVRKDIEITPLRGGRLFDSSDSLLAMDRVQFTCRYELKSHSDDPVNVRVGLSHDWASFFWGETNDESADIPDDFLTGWTAWFLTKCSFVVADSNSGYAVRCEEFEEKSGTPKRFVWEMQFGTLERKVLYVSYCIPMQLGMVYLNERERDYERKWYGDLETGLCESFGYDGTAGKSWFGDVDAESIRVSTRAFDDYITLRPAIEQGDRKRVFMSRMAVCREIAMNCKVDKGEGTLAFSGDPKIGGARIRVHYYLAFLPHTVGDLQELTRRIRPPLGVEELGEFEAIIRAYYSREAPEGPAAAFVKNQRWFEHGDRVSTLPTDVLEELGRMRAGPEQE